MFISEQLYVEIVRGRLELVSKCLPHLLLLFSVLLFKIIRIWKFSTFKFIILRLLTNWRN